MENEKTNLNEDEIKGKSGVVKIVLILTVVAALLLASKFLPVTKYLTDLLTWTEGLGIMGPVVVALFYIVACVFFIPGSILTLGAGFLFGPVWGTITVSIGSTLGAAAAFLVGRFLLRDSIEKKLSGNHKFKAIDKAVGEQGFKIVLLSRLSPVIPFILLNYAYGLTKVSFWRYVLASWIGMLPGTIMYVYFGSTAGQLAKIASGDVKGGSAQTIFFAIGLVVTILVVVMVTRVAQKAFKEAVPEGEGAKD
jgi:uncharacterized membrane protein YdjX (TVP38/TMEM64 family)